MSNLLFDRNRCLLFSEAGFLARYSGKKILHKWDVFEKLLTNAIIPTSNFEKHFGEQVQRDLLRLGLARLSGQDIQVQLRCVPILNRFLLADPIGAGQREHVHLGLDSIYLLNF